MDRHQLRNEHTTKDAERKHAKLGTRLIVGGVIAASALTSAGCSVNAAPAPSETISASPEVEDPALIDSLESLSVEEFVQRPHNEQLTFAAYQRERYADDYDWIMEDSPNYMPYSAAHEANSDVEIVYNLNRAYQVALSTPVDYTYGEFYDSKIDPIQGKKQLSGFLYHNTPNSGVAQDIGEVLDGPSHNASTNALTDTGFFQLQRPDFTGSNVDCTDTRADAPTVCRTIEVKEGDTTGTLKVILVPYSDAVTGEQKAEWLAVEDKSDD